ncbi:hypothetical protein JZO86_14080 [Enterococcus ureasiticus]|uniref:hypothetical protein n=1 Tax=Enterococcus TaxID=1350 RepID=UPI001A8E365C|nr:MULTISPECIES: hypothetical protein [Enterococcus]MBO0433991.1 hypothetical protein [Enterococcus sp. DIV0849a]MBO0474827.1 hypothetical protein [Enterococcus ureasiticus]
MDQTIDFNYYSYYLWHHVSFYDSVRCFFSSTLDYNIKSVNPSYKHETPDFIGGTRQQLLHFGVVAMSFIICLLLSLTM